MRNILIVGATSAIAMACARQWANQKNSFFLVGRNRDRLKAVADDLLVRGAATAAIHILDMSHLEDHPAMLETAFATLSTFDVALVAHGTLPYQQVCEQDNELAVQEFITNGLSMISLLTILANKMQAQGSGTIAVISSVAGDRGRPSNYLYGSAKAAVSIFCEGLRARLFKAGVHVLTIKPGFVDTPMTQDLDLPKILVVHPERIAKDILNAIDKRKNVIYTPWFWRWIMLIIRIVPSFLFKRARI